MSRLKSLLVLLLCLRCSICYGQRLEKHLKSGPLLAELFKMRSDPLPESQYPFSDGYFNMIDSTKAKACNQFFCELYPVQNIKIFRPGSLFCEWPPSYNYDAPKDPNFFRDLPAKGQWGAYKIDGNKITVIKPTLLFRRGMTGRQYLTKFEGVIINKDTIVNWVMVPPYPKVNPKFNDDFIYDLTPRTLIFHPNSHVRDLDTTNMWFKHLSK